MKSKTLLRATVVTLAAAMLTTGLFSCKKNGEDEETSGNGGTVTTDTSSDELYDSNGYLLDKLPNDLNYNGAEINILGWTSEVKEFEVEELNGVPIDESIYKRNISIQDRLGVTLKYDLSEPGYNNKRTEYAQRVERSIGSGAPYDIVSAHTASISLCAMNGYLTDLGSIEDSYLDFEKPWWNSDIVDTCKVGNTFYFCTGDASTSLVQMVYCVYFNADKIESLKLTSPYELVKDNKWTYEEMMLMGMNVYSDDNANNAVDLDDTLPLIGQYYDWPALLNGCGISFVTKDAAGSFVLTDEIKGEKSINVMKKLADFVQLDSALVATDQDLTKNFMGGKSLFLIIQNGAAARWSFSGTDIGYGCVPMPKYDSYQESYYGATRKPVSLFGIPRGTDPDRVAMITAVLECYGSEGYRQTTPVIFEQVMKYQKSSGNEMIEMLELIRDTACFDVGRIYSSHLDSLCDMPGYYLRDGDTWENYINQRMRDVEKKLDTLSQTLIKVAS